MRVTRTGLEGINQELESRSPAEVLGWAWATFGRRAAILSSMQRAGGVLCHMAERAGQNFDVLFVDTGVLHQETLGTRDFLARTHRSLRVITLHPARTLAEQTLAEGVLYLTREGQERCCELRKSEPLRGVKGSYDAVVSSLRRAEGGARKNLRAVELDPELNTLRVHPLVGLTDEGLGEYLAREPGVAVNPLHSMGFPSIGCFTCTTPVRAEEEERAGRWRHLAGVTYCGINPTDRAERKDEEINLEERYRAALFGFRPAGGLGE